MPKLEQYQCTSCSLKYTVEHGGYSCPKNITGLPDCGQRDPVLCTLPINGHECWGCSPCGRSRGKQRCGACVKDKSCPSCKCDIVIWISYAES